MQIHKWGNTNTNRAILLSVQNIPDEYLWEFINHQDYVENVLGKSTFDSWLSMGGGIVLSDEPDPLPRFHKVSVEAFHTEERWLTWLALHIR